MKLKLDKTAVVILFSVFICGLVSVLGWNWLSDYIMCTFDAYIPGKSDDRFMEIVLEAHKNNEHELLHRIATEEAISSLDELPNMLSQPVDVLPLDYLKNTNYNYRVYFDDDLYFDVWIEHGVWPECPDNEFTDEEVISHFQLLQVGNYNEP